MLVKERYLVLGHNGAGKSTFINMLTGLCQPSDGTFTLNVDSKREIGVLPDYSSFTII